MNRIAHHTGSGTAAWLLTNRTGGTPTELIDLFIPKSTVQPATPVEPSIRFRSTEWLIMRSDFTDPAKAVVAAKCGKNDDPHHGHLDVGHFSVYRNGREFIADNGSAVQDKAYFYQDRWTYPLASSIGHNVVMVNGEVQLPCKLKNQPWNERYGGKVVEFRPGRTRDYALLDPSGAYPGKELTGWRRHLILEKPSIVVVLDEVSCRPGADIEARFHSSVSMTVRDRFVMLGDGGDRMALIPFTLKDRAFRSGRHAILAAERNASFRWIPYVGVTAKAPDNRTVLASVILPVGSETEAGAICDSMRESPDDKRNIMLSFRYAGQDYRYRFVSGGDGLALE